MPTDENEDQESPRLRVRLLGATEVVLDGERLRAFDSVRLQRFLALLVLRPELGHRARLAFELWPDSTESQSRTNLRKLLHDFRRGLPGSEHFVDIDSDVVRWITEGPSAVDVITFRSAIEVEDWPSAVDAYSGDLLPACYDDWVLEERTLLHAEALGAMNRLAEAASSKSDHAEAIRYAQAAIQLDPADEASVLIALEGYLALGQRAAALRCYHRYAEVLERELAVFPSDAVQELHQRIQAGAGPEQVERETPKREAAGDSPFVGRRPELAQLDESWSRARSRAAQLVVVAGEPGIGKSRLAEEFSRRLHNDGIPVARARAHEAAGGMPWGPIVDLLRSDALTGSIDALDPVWRRELARLLPELDDSSSEGPALGESGGLASRRRLFDAVTRAIAVPDRPLLLIIDDLQWCDNETVDLLGFILRSAFESPLLIVCTLRSEEIEPDSAVAGLLDSLTREGTLELIPLEPLDEVDTAALAADLQGEDAIEPSLAARIWAESAGNPLFVIEALRAGVSDSSGGALSPTMRVVLGARLGQLSEPASSLASIAAVIGRRFSLDLLAVAAGMAEEDVIDAVDELWRRRIIRDVGHAYDFSHDKLRAVALELLSPARRRLLHREIADAMVSLGDQGEVAAAQLAAHYDQAGLAEPAISAYRTAGDRALAVSALQDSVAMYRRALSLLGDLPASAVRDETELEIRLALGSPLVALEGYGAGASHQNYERALALSRRVGRPTDPPILRGLGLARLQGCRFSDSTEMGLALLNHDTTDPVSMTEGLYLLGVSAFWRGDLSGARDHLVSALDAYDATKRAEHLSLYAQDPQVVCLVRLGWAELWSGNPDTADRMVSEGLETAADLDHLMTLWYAITYAAVVAAEMEDLTRLGELLARADELSDRLPLPYLAILGDALRGWLAAENGSTEAVESVALAVEDSRRESESLHFTYCLLLLARTYALTGHIALGREAIREALSWSKDHDQGYLDAELWRVDGELAIEGSEFESAKESLDTAVQVAQSQSAAWLELRALVSRAQLSSDSAVMQRLTEVCKTVQSRAELPAFRRARQVLGA